MHLFRSMPQNSHLSTKLSTTCRNCYYALTQNFVVRYIGMQCRHTNLSSCDYIDVIGTPACRIMHHYFSTFKRTMHIVLKTQCEAMRVFTNTSSLHRLVSDGQSTQKTTGWKLHFSLLSTQRLLLKCYTLSLSDDEIDLPFCFCFLTYQCHWPLCRYYNRCLVIQDHGYTDWFSLPSLVPGIFIYNPIMFVPRYVVSWNCFQVLFSAVLF